MASASTGADIVPATSTTGDGVLVLVNLDGGNDGLNTVCPAEHSIYRSARGELALDPAAVHPLSEGFFLNPALEGMAALWQAERLAVVHGVGFAGLDRSHFHCRDVWQAGDHTTLATGWVGRWLDSGDGAVHRAVAVDRLLPLLLRGERRSGAVVSPGGVQIPDADTLTGLLAAMNHPDPGRDPLAAAVAASTVDLLDLAQTVGPVLDGGDDHAEVAAPDDLDGHLSTVAALIEADLGTRLFTVTLGGFDTHAGQINTHRSLLTQLDDALSRFVTRMGERPVTVAVWSEFGRRVAANSSGGTDHGKASAMLVAGTVVAGHHGDPPPLEDLDEGDLRTTVDFRSVLGGLAEGVLGASARDLFGPTHKPLTVV